MPHLPILVCGRHPRPVNLTAVAEALAVHPSNASRAVDRLITADPMDRQDAPHDRRSLTLTLIPAGKQLVDRVSEDHRAAMPAVLERMTPDDRDALVYTMPRLAAAAGEPVNGNVMTVPL